MPPYLSIHPSHSLPALLLLLFSQNCSNDICSLWSFIGNLQICKKKMNRCGIQQTTIESSMDARSDGRRFVVCPKPRRPATAKFVLDELSGSKAGSELLDLIITKEGHELSRSNYQTASSPRFFSGSPPCRVSNPLIQEAHFRNAKLHPAPVSASPMPSPARPGSAASPSTSSRKGGCARANIGSKPAVRVEGFDCLDMERRSSSIPAWG